MAVFKPGVPVATSEPFVQVDAGVPAGRHQFRLVVIDDEGNQSRPTIVVVTIVDRGSQ
jgi:hypothetical protein